MLEESSEAFDLSMSQSEKKATTKAVGKEMTPCCLHHLSEKMCDR